MSDKLADPIEPQLSDEHRAGTTIDRAANDAAADLSKPREGRQCIQVKPDGDRCQAQALTGSLLCFFHDPAQAGARAAASKRGGEKTRAAVLPPDTPDAPLRTPSEMSALLDRTINQLLRGQIDSKVANTVGYLMTVKMKTTDLGNLEQRLGALERAVKEKQSEPTLFDPDLFGGE